MGVNLKNRKIAPTCVTLKLIDQKRLYVCNVSSKLWDHIIIWSSKTKLQPSNMKQKVRFLDFDILFGTQRCLICQTYHPRRLPTFDVWRGRPRAWVRPYTSRPYTRYSWAE